MKRKTSRLVAWVMLLVAFAFFVYALGHPEASFPWGSGATYTLYGAYALLMLLLFAAPFKD